MNDAVSAFCFRYYGMMNNQIHAEAVLADDPAN